MNKEQILQSFLEDELFIEKGYLKEGEAQKYKWTDPRKNNLIDVLKLAIDGVMGNESEGITSRKINSHLNP
jgi:hypothetical protein